MPRPRPYAQVGVFSPVPYGGNPVAVVLDAEGMPAADMQRVVRWTNLSETTFVLPATDVRADYRLRIFTPAGELPFAGHPTLGSARAWLENGGRAHDPERTVQERRAGLIPIRRDGGILSFTAPPTTYIDALEQGFLDRVVAAFGVDPSRVVFHQWVDNGPGWAVLRPSTAWEVLDGPGGHPRRDGRRHRRVSDGVGDDVRDAHLRARGRRVRGPGVRVDERLGRPVAGAHRGGRRRHRRDARVDGPPTDCTQ